MPPAAVEGCAPLVVVLLTTGCEAPSRAASGPGASSDVRHIALAAALSYAKAAPLPLAPPMPSLAAPLPPEADAAAAPASDE